MSTKAILKKYNLYTIYSIYRIATSHQIRLHFVTLIMIFDRVFSYSA